MINIKCYYPINDRMINIHKYFRIYESHDIVSKPRNNVMYRYICHYTLTQRYIVIIIIIIQLRSNSGVLRAFKESR